jgi:hypothetical protein
VGFEFFGIEPTANLDEVSKQISIGKFLTPFARLISLTTGLGEQFLNQAANARQRQSPTTPPDYQFPRHSIFLAKFSAIGLGFTD